MVRSFCSELLVGAKSLLSSKLIAAKNMERHLHAVHRQ